MIRNYTSEDKPQVLTMMEELWPGEELEDELFDQQIFVYENDNGELGGFIQVNIREYVDGADSSPCPHIEGWFVKEELRRQGIGKELVQAAELWAREKGFTELTSDALLDNSVSIQAHTALGFTPTEQIQYFKKDL